MNLLKPSQTSNNWKKGRASETGGCRHKARSPLLGCLFSMRTFSASLCHSVVANWIVWAIVEINCFAIDWFRKLKTTNSDQWDLREKATGPLGMVRCLSAFSGHSGIWMYLLEIYNHLMTMRDTPEDKTDRLGTGKGKHTEDVCQDLY